VVNATVQTAVTTDNGLEEVVTWSDGTNVRLSLQPASTALIQRAGLLDDVVTHQAILPRGLSLVPSVNRILVGSDVYRIVEVTPTPFDTIALLERRVA